MNDIEEKRELTDKEKDILLEEYKLCQQKTQSLESTIWKTSGIIGVGSLGGFITLVNTFEPGLVPWLSGVVIIVMVRIWWGIACRWWDIQHVTFSRMRVIEKKLKIYQLRFIRYLDHLIEHKKIVAKNRKATNERQKKKLKREIKKLCQLARSEEIPAHEKKYLMRMHYPLQHKGVKGWLQYFPRLICSLWIVYSLYVFYISLPKILESIISIVNAVKSVLIILN